MNLKRILVPVTLEGGSRSAVAIAANLAEESGASLVLLHAVQLSIAGEERGIPRARFVNELCREAERQMRQLAASVRRQVPTECIACEGRPVDVILQEARALATDMIVMCTHGYCGWLSWLHRHTARQVLRRAPCPVWLISPGNQNAVCLAFVDFPAANQCEDYHEDAHPIQSPLRVSVSGR
ncbi:MAG TPA: universal stress protein [Verrucomicrobiae bacterium]|nr:universal stress protein [Verrucomicrobiae bacterium]